MLQNMSLFTCPSCGTRHSVFGSEGVRRACAKHEVDFLGELPLDPKICEDADRGRPTVVAESGDGCVGVRGFRVGAGRVAGTIGL